MDDLPNTGLSKTTIRVGDHQPEESIPKHRPVLLMQATHMLLQWMLETNPQYPSPRSADLKSVVIAEETPVPDTAGK